MKKGKLFIFSGVSGVGKSTILKKIFEEPNLNLVYSISCTSRSPRHNETDGKEYFFLSKQAFKEKIDKNQFLEWAEFCGNLYGTPKEFVEQNLNDGKNVLLEIEVKGALNVMKLMPEAISIFLLPPSLEELQKRLHERGTESDGVIDQRLKEAKKELSFKEHYDHLVINDNVDEAVSEIVKIIKSGKK